MKVEQLRTPVSQGVRAFGLRLQWIASLNTVHLSGDLHVVLSYESGELIRHDLFAVNAYLSPALPTYPPLHLWFSVSSTARNPS